MTFQMNVEYAKTISISSEGDIIAEIVESNIFLFIILL